MLLQDETPEGLVTAISRGNTHAEAVLLDRYYRRVLFILKKRTRDEELARDLCQDTFRIILERLRKAPLEEPGKLSSFILGTAINLHIAEIRKAVRRKTQVDSDCLEGIVDERYNQTDELARERSRSSVRSLLRELDNERDRKILYRYYIEEMDKEDVCRELALSQRHFDKVISRARKRFRELLGRQRDGGLQEDYTG